MASGETYDFDVGCAGRAPHRCGWRCESPAGKWEAQGQVVIR